MTKRSVSRHATSGIWAEVEITEGNLRNDHFYMRGFIDRFPPDLIGGSNADKAAPRTALIDWGDPTLAETDIDGEDKLFFRKRAWVRSFFAREEAKAGDRVRIEQIAPYKYRISLIKKAAS